MASPNNAPYQPTGKYIGKRAAKYKRLSDEGQEEGYSLEFQEEKISEAIALEGCTFDEKHSWKDTHTGMEIFERPGLNALRAAAKRREFDVLFLYKLDRFSRVDWQQEMVRQELKQYGVTTVTLKKDEHADDDSTLGRVIRAFYGFKAEEERNDILQRTSDGRDTKLRKGYLIGGGKALYGYRWNANGKERTHYLIHPPEAETVARIFAMAKAGMTLRRIAMILTSENIPSPSGTGKPWTISTIKYILSNPFYTGKAVVYRFQRVKVSGQPARKVARPEHEHITLEGVVPALIDVETFEAVQKQLEHNKQLAARNNKHPQDTLLRCGLVICGYCGQRMAVHRGDGMVRYECDGLRKYPDRCKGPSIMAHILDEAVWEHAVEIMRNPALVTEEVNKQRRPDPTQENRKSIKGQLRQIDREIENCTKTHNESKNDTVRGIMMRELERLAKAREDVLKLQRITHDQQEAWAREQKKLDDFVVWCDNERSLLDDPTHQASYEEKRNACERLGMRALVWRVEHMPRYKIGANPPELMFNTVSRVLPVRRIMASSSAFESACGP
jgi:site-specific DNA recombinase